jgi:TetR/AcrR family transcriptional regulator, regulator of mycofactocin system
MSASATDTGTNGWERRRERIGREIERVALELFALSSPEEVTIEQIAAAAGISNRTFFRYFASRDDILAAVPRRALEGLSAHVRARPPSESVLEAFAAAGQDNQDPDDRDMILLWGIVVNRSPEAAARALGHSAVGIADAFQPLIAERLGLETDDPRVGPLAAAIAGLVSFVYHRWVNERGSRPLSDMLAEAFDSLGDLAAPGSDGGTVSSGS